MTIRKIITSAAIAAFLGLAGGSAYAGHEDSHTDDQVTSSTEVTSSTDGVEQTRLPDHILETINLN